MTQPFPETDYKKFYPLAEVLTQASKQIKLSARELRNHPESKNLIEAKLKALGFRRISGEFRRGSRALILEGNDHQILRIVSANIKEAERSNDPCVLQPLMTFKCGEGAAAFRIEVLPKVHVLTEILDDTELSDRYHVDHESFYSMVRDLSVHLARRKDPQIFSDFCRDNIGVILDKNGKPVPLVIDAGAVLGSSMFDKPFMVGQTQSYLDRFVYEYKLDISTHFHTRNEFSWPKQISSRDYLKSLGKERAPQYNFQEAQDHHLKTLGLSRNKIKGVISDAALKKYREQRKAAFMLAPLGLDQELKDEMLVRKRVYTPATREVMKMADEYGLTDSEIQAILKTAHAKGEKDYRRAVIAARDEYRSTLPQGMGK